MWKQVVARVRQQAAGDEEPSSPTAATPAVPADPPAAAPRYLIFPDELPDPAAGEPAPPAGRTARAARVAGYMVVGALAALGAVSLFTTPTPPPAPAAAPEVRPGAGTDASPLDARATAVSAVGLAVASFELRERLFANHQMQCADLARGLVLVEERWTAYSTVHPAAGPAPDSSRDANDRSLYSRVDQVERRFERSGCARP